jgi:hypothetical protein
VEAEVEVAEAELSVDVPTAAALPMGFEVADIDDDVKKEVTAIVFVIVVLAAGGVEEDTSELEIEESDEVELVSCDSPTRALIGTSDCD